MVFLCVGALWLSYFVVAVASCQLWIGYMDVLTRWMHWLPALLLATITAPLALLVPIFKWLNGEPSSTAALVTWLVGLLVILGAGAAMRRE